MRTDPVSVQAQTRSVFSSLKRMWPHEDESS